MIHHIPILSIFLRTYVCCSALDPIYAFKLNNHQINHKFFVWAHLKTNINGQFRMQTIKIYKSQANVLWIFQKHGLSERHGIYTKNVGPINYIFVLCVIFISFGKNETEMLKADMWLFTCWYQTLAVWGPAPHRSVNMLSICSSSLDLNSSSLRSPPLSTISHTLSASLAPTPVSARASCHHVQHQLIITNTWRWLKVTVLEADLHIFYDCQYIFHKTCIRPVI